MSKNVKFKVEKRSYPKNSAIVDIDVDDGVQEVTFGGDTCLDVDLYDVKKQFPDVKRLIIKNNIASISISNFMFPCQEACYLFHVLFSFFQLPSVSALPSPET